MLNIKMPVAVPVTQGSEPMEVENILYNFNGINGPMSLTIHCKIKTEDLGNETDEELVYVFGEYHGLENNCSSKDADSMDTDESIDESIDIDKLFKLEIENSKDKINFYIEDDKTAIINPIIIDETIYINRVRHLLREKEAQGTINNIQFDFRLGVQFPPEYRDVMLLILSDYTYIKDMYKITVVNNNTVINKTYFDNAQLKNVNHHVNKYIEEEYKKGQYYVDANNGTEYVIVNYDIIISWIQVKMLDIFYEESTLTKYIELLFKVELIEKNLLIFNNNDKTLIRKEIEANFLIKRLILKNKFDIDIFIQKLSFLLKVAFDENTLKDDTEINTQFIDIFNKIEKFKDEATLLFENQEKTLSTFLITTNNFDYTFLEARYKNEFQDIISRINIVRDLIISYFKPLLEQKFLRENLTQDQVNLLLNFTNSSQERYDYFLKNNKNYEYLSTFIMAGTAFLSDYVAIANLINNNYDSKNSIIYAGNAHAEHFRKILELGGYVEIGSFGERKLYEGKTFTSNQENSSRCLDVSHLQFPFFKMDILNSLIDAKIKELKQI